MKFLIVALFAFVVAACGPTGSDGQVSLKVAVDPNMDVTYNGYFLGCVLDSSGTNGCCFLNVNGVYLNAHSLIDPAKITLVTTDTTMTTMTPGTYTACMTWSSATDCLQGGYNVTVDLNANQGAKGKILTKGSEGSAKAVTVTFTQTGPTVASN